MFQLLSLLGLSSSETAREHMLFEEWTEIFGDFPNAISASKSQELRKRHYEENVQKIKTHNAMGHTWKLGVNAYADLTSDEFASLHSRKMCGEHMQKGQAKASILCLGATKEERNSNNPPSVDWRDFNAVTPVKTQGSCGSCWTFATTGAIEGAWKLAGGNITDLSEQQLIDCNTGKIYGEEANNGCKGGSMDPAFKYIMANHGLATAKHYPYRMNEGHCRKNLANETVVNLSGYKDVNVGDEIALENALAIGPVALGIEADQTAFQLYSHGVFSGKCGAKLDHGVLAIGYGHDEDEDKDYWIVKNSWGTSWGEKGYIRIERGAGGAMGLCGVLSMPTYPIVQKGSFTLATEPFKMA